MSKEKDILSYSKLLVSTIAILCLFITQNSYTQEIVVNDSITLQKFEVVDGDTVLLKNIAPVSIYAPPKLKNQWARWKYARLTRYVKKVYPYAKAASKKLAEYEANYKSFETERERKKYLKKIEKELFTEYEGKLMKLTISQGRILMRLVDRETGSTTYTILKDLKGNFSAAFWQTVAKMFGNNLKTPYDPSIVGSEDYFIEIIVEGIEAGML